MRLNPFSSGSSDTEDYGFGTQVARPGVRLMDKNGDFNVERRGGDRSVYQWMIHMSWTKFFLLVASYYLLINLAFGFFYLALGMDGITGDHAAGFPGSLGSAFFFSVQTFTTVGYGQMAPVGMAHQLLATTEALVGLMSVALATGLLFARFSRPRNLFRFSPNAVIAPYRDGRAFMFRLANPGSTKLINVSAQVVFSWTGKGDTELPKRYFKALELERAQISMFPLNWTIVHPITEDSPLSGIDSAWMSEHDAEFVVQVSGFDETYARQVYAHSSYLAECLSWGARFVPMYHPSDEGRTVLDLNKIGEAEEAPLPAEKPHEDTVASPTLKPDAITGVQIK